ncbi:hypothetical protein, partial [Streptomyces sp. NPDC002845]
VGTRPRRHYPDVSAAQPLFSAHPHAHQLRNSGRREHAAETRELKDTLATYANQIQVLTLRNAELEAQNTSLLERLRQCGDNVAVLSSPSSR